MTTERPFIVVWDDEMGLCVPMGSDADCEGAICGMTDRGVAMFASRADARHAIRISTAWAKLQQAIGQPYNADFIEGRRHLRIVPLVVWGVRRG